MFVPVVSTIKWNETKPNYYLKDENKLAISCEKVPSCGVTYIHGQVLHSAVVCRTSVDYGRTRKRNITTDHRKSVLTFMDVMQDIGKYCKWLAVIKSAVRELLNVFIKCKGVNEGQIIIIFKKQQNYCTYYIWLCISMYLWKP